MRFSGSAGHNTPYNHGAVYGGYAEDTLNKSLWNRVMRYLKELEVDVVDCTPSTATSKIDSLERRCNTSDESGAEYFMDVHFNMGTGRGCECFYISEGGKVLAEKLCAELSSALSIPNRGAKYSNELYVLKHTDAKAVLIETCFLDSDDMLHYNEDKAARAIAKAITGKAVLDKPAEVKREYVRETQKLMNRLGIVGANGRPLDEDNIYGVNTEYALTTLLKHIRG